MSRKTGKGKWFKRRYNRAMRRYYRGHGKECAIAHALSELHYRGT